VLGPGIKSAKGFSFLGPGTKVGKGSVCWDLELNRARVQFLGTWNLIGKRVQFPGTWN
jgi:hypothetical protein